LGCTPRLRTRPGHHPAGRTDPTGLAANPTNNTAGKAGSHPTEMLVSRRATDPAGKATTTRTEPTLLSVNRLPGKAAATPDCQGAATTCRIPRIHQFSPLCNANVLLLSHHACPTRASAARRRRPATTAGA